MEREPRDIERPAAEPSRSSELERETPQASDVEGRTPPRDERHEQPVMEDLGSGEAGTAEHSG